MNVLRGCRRTLVDKRSIAATRQGYPSHYKLESIVATKNDTLVETELKSTLEPGETIQYTGCVTKQHGCCRAAVTIFPPPAEDEEPAPESEDVPVEPSRRSHLRLIE